MQRLSATYSPEDNKLRLYASSRLDKDLYDRIKANGFTYAPKQELFVAPMWTPHREDLLLELCGEIDDEDTSLVERQEQRAERFDTYSDKRAQDAERAYKGVSAIADNIPLGQPILIGHHSERHARKDAERIENGMRKAVSMWKTSEYWERRAKGALDHAKYKELPGVRARRIKTLEAELRSHQRDKAKAQVCLDLWNTEGMTHEMATAIASRTEAGYLRLPRKAGDKEDWSYTPSAYDALTDTVYTLYAPRTLEEVIEYANIAYPATFVYCDRWIEHISLRLGYEKAMLAEAGASSLLDKKPRPALLPLCNYRCDSITTPNEYHRGEMLVYKQIEMTSKQYAAIYGDYKGTRVVENSHRVRTAYYKQSHVCVFLTDSKVHIKPDPVSNEKRFPIPDPPAVQWTPQPDKPEAAKFEALQENLKSGGVKVVSAPQLFPTPPALAKRMVTEADIEEGMSVLEPSAGTGRLIQAMDGIHNITVLAVEMSCTLADNLCLRCHTRTQVQQADFLCVQAKEIGPFDRIVMNPPFENGADIKHIQHALSFLRPRGRLVAICANGPRQRQILLPLAESSGGYWEELPAGTFTESGTNVNTALLVIEG